MKKFDLRPFLSRRPHLQPDDNFEKEAPSLEQDPLQERRSSTGLDRLTWAKSPFPLLVCMPFSKPEIVAETWRTHIEAALQNLGKVIRIDWETGDWVRDFREVVSQAAFVILDLTSTNPNVIRELKFILEEDFPLFCYMHRPPGIQSGQTILGKVLPELAVRDTQGRVDIQILNLPVVVADYSSRTDLEELCAKITNTLIPYQDTYDPSAPYVGTDVNALPFPEQEGFSLARIHRSKIISQSERFSRQGDGDYWAKAQQLFSSSAIYRARVLSWLETPNLLRDTAENLWIREHLLWAIARDVHSGNKLNSEEIDIIHAYIQREPNEEIRFQAQSILSALPRAENRPPALNYGLPSIPSPVQGVPSSSQLSINLTITSQGDAPCLRASQWADAFPDTAERLITVFQDAPQAPVRARSCRITVSGGPWPDQKTWPAELEDSLDATIRQLGSIVQRMKDEYWAQPEIATTLKALLSAKILQELALKTGQKVSANPIHELRSYFGYIWERDPRDLYLFEFQSRFYGCHFRGLLPWPDVKESVTRYYARAAAAILEQPLDEIFQISMSWDLPPGQLWDILLVEKANEVIEDTMMRTLWCRYVIPSASLYWNIERIFFRPDGIDRWAYVLTE